jgi:hypothetical protein
MRLVERHTIKESHQDGKEIYRFFLSQNLCNYADYLVRQSLIVNQAYLNHSQIYYQVKKTPDYLA